MEAKLPHSRTYEKCFLIFHKLEEGIKKIIKSKIKGKNNLILDVGCGAKPYYKLFEKKSKKYIGIDVLHEEAADIICSADDLPIRSNVFDVVLCTQVLEHVEDPEKTLKEVHRVLKKNGLIILSTHGIWVKHSAPHDYWRWTRFGLLKIFKNFKNVEIKNVGGSALCYFQITSLVLNRLPRIIFFKPLLIVFSNLLGLFFDRIIKDDRLIIDYIVTARK